jgi:hypothetical protein
VYPEQEPGSVIVDSDIQNRLKTNSKKPTILLLKMNFLQKIMTTGLMAAAMTSMASAVTPNYVYFTGSSAYRAALTVAIINRLGGTSCRTAFYGSSPVGKATYQIFANGTIGGSGTATTVVLANWTGSLAGVVDLVDQNPNLNFINPADATVISEVNSSIAAGTTGSPLCTQTGSGSNIGYTNSTNKIASTPAVASHAPDVAMTDAFQGSVAASISTCGTIATSTTLNNVAYGPIKVGGVNQTSGSQLASSIANATLLEAGVNTPGAGTASGTVGYVPFEWILGNINGATAPFSNMTQQAAETLINQGYVPVAMLDSTSGATHSSNTSDFAFLVGRSEDSATRIDSMAETQYGFGNAPAQFQLTFSNDQNTTGAIPQPSTGLNTGGDNSTHSAHSTVQSFDYWPSSASLNTVPQVNWNTLGHGGYVSGGDVANVLGSINPLTVNETGVTSPVTSVYISAADAPSELTAGTSKVYFIGYIGIADAGGVSTTIVGGTALTYNGVPYSANGVVSGAYSDWGFEHAYVLSGTPAATGGTSPTPQYTFVNNVADDVAATYAPSDSSGNVNPSSGAGAGIIYNPLAGVTRTQEGSEITINY